MTEWTQEKSLLLSKIMTWLGVENNLETAQKVYHTNTKLNDRETALDILNDVSKKCSSVELTSAVNDALKRLQSEDSKMTIVNMTPHPITFLHNSGERTTYPVSGSIARVEAVISEVPSPISGTIAQRTEFTGFHLPPKEDTIFIISALCLPFCIGRDDIVSPATGPKDEVVRTATGQIDAVTKWNLP